MKKTIYYILPLLAFLLMGTASCDITRKPKGTPEQAPFKNMLDVEMNRDAIYALLRNTESPNTLNYPDYMSDLYQVTKSDNGSYGPFYEWQEQSVIDHDFLTTYYYFNYYSAMQANYFIMRAEEFINNENVKKSEDDIKLLKQYIGETKVVRALAHWRIVQRFARPWHEGDPATREMGIIVMDKYDPLGTAKEKKRSRKDVYDFIYKDLDDAIAAIPADANKEVKPAIRITQDYAYAVKARAALTREDWDTAAKCSQWVIDRYPLSPKEEINRIWVTEDSPEILVRLYTTPSIGGIRAEVYGGGYVDEELEDGTKIRRLLHVPVMVLAKWVVDVFEKDKNDVRYHAFIDDDFYLALPWFGEEKTNPTAIAVPYKSIAKFKGNPSLNKEKDRPEFKFGLHLFHVGEAYLINIEANLRNKEGFQVATENFQRLKEARGTQLLDFPNPDEMLKELKEERVRELVGEGFRMDDLVRWGEGMKRKPAMQPGNIAKHRIKPVANDLEISADNKMMIWEFPTRDINQNADLSANRNWK